LRYLSLVDWRHQHVEGATAERDWPAIDGQPRGDAAAGSARPASGLSVFPGDPHQASVSPPLMALLMLGLLAVPLLIAAAYRTRRPAPRIASEAWTCGYQHTARMTVSSGGLMEPVRVMFRGVYWRHGSTDASRAGTAALDDVTTFAARIEPLWDNTTTRYADQGVRQLGRRLQALEGGNLRAYCLYIFLALAAVLLAVTW
jgi:hydrogenase-4 component B